MRGGDTVAGVRQRAVVMILVVVAFALVMLATLLQGVPVKEDRPSGVEIEVPSSSPIEPETPEPLPTSTVEPSEPNEIFQVDDRFYSALIALGLALILFLLRKKLAALFRAWTERRANRHSVKRLGVGLNVAPEVASMETAAEEVVAAARSAYKVLSTTTEPTDAIIAAWMAFEEAVGKAGRTRGVAETPAEFVVRVVGERESAKAETIALLTLYENVRFGSLVATNSDREAAKRALNVIAEVWA